MSTLDEVVAITTRRPSKARDPSVEICEHKGIGHPDSICDGAAEAVAQALCREYLRLHGEIQHFNVDKALLVGGASLPRFGGGAVQMPMRLIIAGRATPLDRALSEVVESAARGYLAATLRCDPTLFQIECAIRPGSAELRQVYARERRVPIANDTSIGAGYAPQSRLEQMTLRLAATLRSAAFRSRFPAAGDDYKLMAVRSRGELRFTVALAFVDREVSSSQHYFALKAEVTRCLEAALDEPARVALNTLDFAAAESEAGLYLTVTGLSAEQGDDGQAGRGNRINGLITPSRPMSLEAACGKNPAGHVGKLYNVLAREIAQQLCTEVSAIRSATVQIVSAIGRPVAQPQLLAIEVATSTGSLTAIKRQIRRIIDAQFERLDEITQQLIAGKVALF